MRSTIQLLREEFKKDEELTSLMITSINKNKNIALRLIINSIIELFTELDELKAEIRRVGSGIPKKERYICKE